MKNRLWEIDFFRGIAIVMMVIFHLLFDLNYFGIYTINVDFGFWKHFARITAFLFILLVGVSMTLKYLNNRQFYGYAKRGIEIFLCGMIVTAATYLFIGEGYVKFGILHMIGVSMIVTYPLVRYRFVNVVLGFIILSLGYYLKTRTFDFNWLFWLGFLHNEFYSLDYFPLLPWLGVVLFGIALGNFLYFKNERRFKLFDFSRQTKFIGFLGRHSLLIYLLHQPLIVALIYLIK